MRFLSEILPAGSVLLNFLRISSTCIHTCARACAHESRCIWQKAYTNNNDPEVKNSQVTRLFTISLPFERQARLDSVCIWEISSYHFTMNRANRTDVSSDVNRGGDVTSIRLSIERGSCPTMDIALSPCLYIFFAHYTCCWITDINIDVRFSL